MSELSELEALALPDSPHSQFFTSSPHGPGGGGGDGARARSAVLTISGESGARRGGAPAAVEGAIPRGLRARATAAMMTKHMKAERLPPMPARIAPMRVPS